MPRSRLVRSALAAILMLSTVIVCNANAIIEKTTKQKIADSDVVVIGTVTEIEIPDEASKAILLARLQITGILKNSKEQAVHEDEDLFFAYRTGSAESSLTYVCCKVGGQYLLFLRRAPGRVRHYGSVNAVHGVYDLSRPAIR